MTNLGRFIAGLVLGLVSTMFVVALTSPEAEAATWTCTKTSDLVTFQSNQFRARVYSRNCHNGAAHRYESYGIRGTNRVPAGNCAPKKAFKIKGVTYYFTLHSNAEARHFSIYVPCYSKGGETTRYRNIDSSIGWTAMNERRFSVKSVIHINWFKDKSQTKYAYIG